jgi:hypothetical protein
MTPKLAVTGSLLAGLVLWIWGGVVHTALPEPMTKLADQAAVTAFVKQNMPQNGAYYDGRGMIVSLYGMPAWVDQTDQMGSYLGKELLANLFQAFLLLLLFTRLRAMDSIGYGMAGALAGLIAWVAVDASLTIWYGFPLAMLGVGFLDNVVGGFLAGLTLGWAIRKFR